MAVSLLLLPFMVQIAIHTVNTFGATAINDFLWQLFSLLPNPSPNAAKARTLRREVVQLNRELAAVSAQDEFSKWAKIRRKLDKVNAEYEAVAAQQASSRATFDSIVNKLRWAGTNGLRFFLQFWYSKVPVFWLPKGWVPYWAEWCLAFPRAPTGSISVQVWWIACASAIALCAEAVGAAVMLTRHSSPIVKRILAAGLGAAILSYAFSVAELYFPEAAQHSAWRYTQMTWNALLLIACLSVKIPKVPQVTMGQTETKKPKEL